MRTYERTHPWISFRADLRRAPAALWMLLGEAVSKCDHLAGVPLQPETAERLYSLYLAKGVRATTAIEGNTLSEEEVVRHLEGRLKLPPSKEYLTKEIDNIVAACNQVWRDVRGAAPPEITPAIVKRFNRQVLEGANPEEGVVAGEVRSHSVGVGRYRGAPVDDCEYLLSGLCDWLNGPDFDPGSDGVARAILKAVLAHLYLAWIHPFGDGNGRTARLVEFQILVTAGVPMPAAHLLSNHYNETRTEYYRQLDRASQSGGDVIDFLVYAIRGLVDQLGAQLREVRSQQWDVAWENYVHELFQHRNSSSDVRRRHLVLDLSEGDSPVRFSDISTVSTRIAKAYANKTSKTVSRDINALIAMGLIEKTGGGYRARRELILAFLPPRNASEEAAVTRRAVSAR